jgi:hypothetical protein
MVSWTSFAPRVFTRASGAILATKLAMPAVSSGSPSTALARPSTADS